MSTLLRPTPSDVSHASLGRDEHDGTTVVEAICPAGRGEVGLRGSHAPLSWEHTATPVLVDGDRQVFGVAVAPGELLEVKVVRGDDDWAGGRNYTLHAGDHLRLEPDFDRTVPELQEAHCVTVDGETITFDVMLPPSYREHERKRYPVLYVLDGQALWSSSRDPFGIWSLERVFGSMYDLGAIDELIVVEVHSSEDRLRKLSPFADPENGGGGGPHFLAAIADDVKPHVDATYRTRPGPGETAILGSSMREA